MTLTPPSPLKKCSRAPGTIQKTGTALAVSAEQDSATVDIYSRLQTAAVTRQKQRFVSESRFVLLDLNHDVMNIHEL